jgi:hypothetical protein
MTSTSAKTGRAEHERRHAAARQARGGQLQRAPARGQHGDDGERREAREGEAQDEAHQHGERLARQARLAEVRAPPQRDVQRRADGDGDAHAARQVRSRRAPAPPRPGREQATRESDAAREQPERGHEIERQHHEVPRLAQQATVEAGGGERRRQAEQHAAHDTDPRGRPQRRAEGRRARGVGQHEAVERAVEVAEPPELLADRLDRGQRRSLRTHQGSQRPLKR